MKTITISLVAFFLFSSLRSCSTYTSNDSTGTTTVENNTKEKNEPKASSKTKEEELQKLSLRLN